MVADIKYSLFMFASQETSIEILDLVETLNYEQCLHILNVYDQEYPVLTIPSLYQLQNSAP